MPNPSQSSSRIPSWVRVGFGAAAIGAAATVAAVIGFKNKPQAENQEPDKANAQTEDPLDKELMACTPDQLVTRACRLMGKIGSQFSNKDVPPAEAKELGGYYGRLEAAVADSTAGDIFNPRIEVTRSLIAAIRDASKYCNADFKKRMERAITESYKGENPVFTREAASCTVNGSQWHFALDTDFNFNSLKITDGPRSFTIHFSQPCLPENAAFLANLLSKEVVRKLGEAGFVEMHVMTLAPLTMHFESTLEGKKGPFLLNSTRIYSVIEDRPWQDQKSDVLRIRSSELDQQKQVEKTLASALTEAPISAPIKKLLTFGSHSYRPELVDPSEIPVESRRTLEDLLNQRLKTSDAQRSYSIKLGEVLRDRRLAGIGVDKDWSGSFAPSSRSQFELSVHETGPRNPAGIVTDSHTGLRTTIFGLPPVAVNFPTSTYVDWDSLKGQIGVRQLTSIEMDVVRSGIIGLPEGEWYSQILRIALGQEQVIGDRELGQAQALQLLSLSGRLIADDPAIRPNMIAAAQNVLTWAVANNKPETLNALAAMPGKRVSDAIGENLNSPSAKLRGYTVLGLAGVKHFECTNQLKRALVDTNPEVRCRAAHELANRSRPECIVPLCEFVRDGPPKPVLLPPVSAVQPHRELAAVAAPFGDSPTVQLTFAGLMTAREPNWEAAAIAAAIKDPKMVPILQVGLGNTSNSEAATGFAQALLNFAQEPSLPAAMALQNARLSARLKPGNDFAEHACDQALGRLAKSHPKLWLDSCVAFEASPSASDQIAKCKELIRRARAQNIVCTSRFRTDDILKKALDSRTGVAPADRTVTYFISRADMNGVLRTLSDSIAKFLERGYDVQIVEFDSIDSLIRGEAGLRPYSYGFVCVHGSMRFVEAGFSSGDRGDNGLIAISPDTAKRLVDGGFGKRLVAGGGLGAISCGTGNSRIAAKPKDEYNIARMLRAAVPQAGKDRIEAPVEIIFIPDFEFAPNGDFTGLKYKVENRLIESIKANRMRHPPRMTEHDFFLGDSGIA